MRAESRALGAVRALRSPRSVSGGGGGTACRAVSVCIERVRLRGAEELCSPASAPSPGPHGCPPEPCRPLCVGVAVRYARADRFWEAIGVAFAAGWGLPRCRSVVSAYSWALPAWCRSAGEGAFCASLAAPSIEVLASVAPGALLSRQGNHHSEGHAACIRLGASAAAARLSDQVRARLACTMLDPLLGSGTGRSLPKATACTGPGTAGGILAEHGAAARFGALTAAAAAPPRAEWS